MSRKKSRKKYIIESKNGLFDGHVIVDFSRKDMPDVVIASLLQWEDLPSNDIDFIVETWVRYLAEYAVDILIDHIHWWFNPDELVSKLLDKHEELRELKPFFKDGMFEIVLNSDMDDVFAMTVTKEK